jgi:hypothetical protein
MGEFWSLRVRARAFAELLIDCEEDRMLWAVLFGMLRKAESRWTSSSTASRSRNSVGVSILEGLRRVRGTKPLGDGRERPPLQSP